MIPFNKPHHAPAEREYVNRALDDNHWSGDGGFTKKAGDLLSPLVGGGEVLLTTSCTGALEMAFLLLDLQPGDEVIVPSFTFVSCANAVSLRGAIPVFVDSRPDTFNIDERLIEDAITKKTKAILVVHYAGVAVELDVISAIAEKHGLVLIEDNAHGLGGTHQGKPLGSFGAMATQSFHVTKNVACGEGGALIINDPSLVARAEIIREKGTNRSQFFRGMVDKYRWVDLGSSYLPSEILAALLASQLEAFDDIQKKRHHAWSRYRAELSEWAHANDVRMQSIDHDREHPAHIFAIVMPSYVDQLALIEHLKTHDVMATFHYQPLDDDPPLPARGNCPVSRSLGKQLVRLPLFADLTDVELDHIINSVTSYECQGTRT